jgi:ech hydrogenase subunit D
MSALQVIDKIAVESLLDRVRAIRQQGCRLVQVSATRLAETIELTYSFEKDDALTSLRVEVPAADPRVPSICEIYGCVLLYENEIHDLFNVHVENMKVDFKGNLYKTSIPYAFGTAPPTTKKIEPGAKPPVGKTTCAVPTKTE